LDSPHWGNELASLQWQKIAACARYGFAGDCGADGTEAAGATLPAGKTPAPESGAAELAGDA